MNNWSEGYVADIGYTYGYYPELNPLRMRLALLYSGLVCPEVRNACELGFGQGISVAAHAAASPVQWHGTDFNPEQAGLAQELARASGAAAQLHDASFAEFCARQDLPDFDFIGLHGIWTWVNDGNREVIVDFIRRKLKVGGVVYLSQNTLPGWSTLAPVRRLMTDHVATAVAPGESPAGRIDAALAFVDKVLATQPAFQAAHADVLQRVAALKTLDKSYLAHEYFNQAWQPMYFSELAAWMARAKLAHACSARYLDHIEALNLAPAQHALLGQIADPTLRQTVRDFMVNQQFRKDYWIKGARRLTPFEQSAQLREQRVVLTAHRPDITLQVNGITGEANLNPTIYAPLLDALADHRPRTLGELEQDLAKRQISFAQLAQAVMVLVGQGRLEPAAAKGEAQQARQRTDALNQHLTRRACGSADITTLASPLTGGGLTVLRASQLFLLARAQGQDDPQAWARFAWNILSAQGQTLMKDGKPLHTAADNIAQLTVQAQAFAEKQLPLLKALQVA
ncbi:MAG: methyltransferase regulatory domain-containing protein [Burkholderiales bacterium]|nr:methyltransferase regulatory domain-containing protein [Burkholderiales bacterium]